ncbi:UDP-N-acetylglucosamine--N-acetylmuramyl-(pentapeptide) pyrophosphoryl-undecaprenol N-acetylglucosamine transferase [Patescibacteria group bacterium]|nr:UDP-N-acetylglucosamine--N-acetylmuramyl-(pentapeptide) pyrophosphoryl-undecaprenol N-acetylglucosamine transferase [Patescibacteria group bacterium]
MKVVITGGHLSPAIAVIEKLKNSETVFIGRRYGLEGDKAESYEYKIIKSLGIPFFEIKTGRLQRKITKNTIPSFFKIPAGFLKSLQILRQTKPDVVLGFGGYVSLPVIFAAYFLKIPIVIHEQTLESGIANKIAAYFAKTVCVSWPSSLKYFPKRKTVITGNPLREEILNIKSQKIDTTDNLIYITGGSLGSHQINILVEQVLERLLENFKIIHQVGDSKEFNDYERLFKKRKKLPQDLQEKYSIFKFIEKEKVGEIINKAGFVIGRSGINTVSELIYLNKPAILIPLSFSQKNEQLKNALFAKEVGLVEVLSGKIEPKDLLEEVVKITSEINNYKVNKNFLIKENAAELIVEELKKSLK